MAQADRVPYIANDSELEVYISKRELKRNEDPQEIADQIRNLINEVSEIYRDITTRAEYDSLQSESLIEL